MLQTAPHTALRAVEFYLDEIAGDDGGASRATGLAVNVDGVPGVSVLHDELDAVPDFVLRGRRREISGSQVELEDACLGPLLQ